MEHGQGRAQFVTRQGDKLFLEVARASFGNVLDHDHTPLRLVVTLHRLIEARAGSRLGSAGRRRY